MLTRFEKARIIAARALQISMGAPILITTNLKNPGEIALKEFEEGVLPLNVVRELPDGTKEIIDVTGEVIGKTKK